MPSIRPHRLVFVAVVGLCSCVRDPAGEDDFITDAGTSGDTGVVCSELPPKVFPIAPLGD